MNLWHIPSLRHLLLRTLLFCGLLLVGTTMGIFLPINHWRKASEEHRQLAADVRELKRLALQKQVLNEFNHVAESELRSDLAKLQIYTDNQTYLRDFSNLADNTHVSLLSLVMKESDAWLQANLVVEGKAENIVDFLFKLESQPYPLKIDQARIHAQKEELSAACTILIWMSHD